MRRTYRLLSRCLVLLLLLTVLAPKFGWQVIEGTVTHHHAAATEAADEPVLHHEHHASFEQHLLPDKGAAGAVKAHALAELAENSGDQACADTQHHCCPGHQLSHMQGGAIEVCLLPEPVISGLLALAVASRFSNFIPAGPERPPRVAAA